MRRLPVFGLLIAAAAGLAGCGCGSKQCAPCSPYATDLLVRVSLDSLADGFRRAEVRSIYLVRYADEALQTPIDTAHQRAAADSDIYYARGTTSLQTLFDYRPSPLPIGGYRLAIPAAGRRYDFTDLDIVGETGQGCCACLRNTRRRFHLNGVPITADGDAAPPVLLRR